MYWNTFPLFRRGPMIPLLSHRRTRSATDLSLPLWFPPAPASRNHVASKQSRLVQLWRRRGLRARRRVSRSLHSARPSHRLWQRRERLHNSFRNRQEAENRAGHLLSQILRNSIHKCDVSCFLHERHPGIIQHQRVIGIRVWKQQRSLFMNVKPRVRNACDLKLVRNHRPKSDAVNMLRVSITPRFPENPDISNRQSVHIHNKTAIRDFLEILSIIRIEHNAEWSRGYQFS